MLRPSPVLIASASTSTTGALTASLGTTTGGDVYWYCSGFNINYGGATAGAIVVATLAGLQGGTMSFPLVVPTGVTTGGGLNLDFDAPLAGTAPNTAITLSLPALGAGSTSAAINLRGFKGDRTLG